MHKTANWFLLAFVAAQSLAVEARGVVVLPKGGGTPVMGHVVREDEGAIVVRQELEAEKSRDVSISRENIEELIVTVAPERLAELEPNQPRMYAEYAEELAEKRRDPEARDAARRLLAIAAHRGDEQVRRSALLGLIDLARSPDEERRLRAIAYLHDPRHDGRALSADVVPGQENESAIGELRAAIRLVRQGKGLAARDLLNNRDVRAELTRHSAIISGAELEAAANARTLTDKQLIRLLRSELALEQAGGGLAPVPSLALEKLTEFDVEECVFRGGKWVRP